MRGSRWWFRVLFLGVLALALGTYLFAATPWRQWLGWTPDYHAEIAQGDRIVTALQAFKAQRGLWPEYLDDLSPAFLPEPPGPAWFYEVSPAQGRSPKPEASPEAVPRRQMLPALSRLAPQEGPHTHLGYDFDPAAPAWRIFGNENARVLRAGPPAAVGGITATSAPATAALGSAPRILPAQLAELDRRIAREPANLDHWRTKASLLVAAGDRAQARDVLEKTIAAFPDTAWPRLALALLELSRAGTQQVSSNVVPAPVQQFTAWVNSHPGFTACFDLAWLDRACHLDRAADDAIAAALKQPPELDPDDPHILPYYFWQMARWALADKNWPRAIALANAWESSQKDDRVKEQSYLAIRAAAEWAQGDATAARRDIAALPPTAALWADHLTGPAGLRAAIDRGDKAFHYDPGDFPAEYQVFEAPE